MSSEHSLCESNDFFMFHFWMACILRKLLITDEGCDLIPSACLQKQNVEECQHQQKYDLIYFFHMSTASEGRGITKWHQNLKFGNATVGLVKNFTSEAATTDLH